MRAAFVFFLATLLGACAHSDVAIDSTRSVAVLAAGAIIATMLSGDDGVEPAPQLDPTRPVSEQDCTKPIETSGNLRCR